MEVYGTHILMFNIYIYIYIYIYAVSQQIKKKYITCGVNQKHYMEVYGTRIMLNTCRVGSRNFQQVEFCRFCGSLYPQKSPPPSPVYLYVKCWHFMAID